jgi:hypothetical protein
MLCFFNVVGSIYDPDRKGVEMPTISAARIHAAKYVAEIIRDQPEAVWTGDEVRVEVTDLRQLVLFTIIVFGVDAAASQGHPADFRPQQKTY